MLSTSNKQIKKILRTDIYIDEYMIEYWNSVIPLLKMKHGKTFKTIDPVTANKYIFDFHGILKNIFQIDEKYFIPITLVNDMKSSNEYTGNIREIIIPDLSVLDNYYNEFLIYCKRRKKNK